LRPFGDPRKRKKGPYQGNCDLDKRRKGGCRGSEGGQPGRWRKKKGDFSTKEVRKRTFYHCARTKYKKNDWESD